MRQHIDIHCHVIAPDSARFPANPLGGKQSQWAASRPMSAERMLDRMQENGITSAVLVQATTHYGYDNSYILECVRRWPERFTAVGTVDPVKPGAARWLADARDSGLAGVRLFTAGSTLSGQSDSFVRPESAEFWHAAEDLQLPVCLQLRLDSALDDLHTVLQGYPRAKIVLDHCGYPPIEQDTDSAVSMLTRLAEYPRLMLKLTHRNLEPLSRLGSRGIDFLRPVVDAFTAARIAWGSNCPAAEQPLTELVDLAEEVLAPLSQDEIDSILCATASHIYPAVGGSVHASSN